MPRHWIKPPKTKPVRDKFFDKPEFVELQKTWYGKLAKTGFKDAERNEIQLQNNDSAHLISRFTPAEFVARQGYFEKARQFGHVYKFRTLTDRIMWTAWADSGQDMVSIAKRLKKSTYTINKKMKVIKGAFVRWANKEGAEDV